MNKSNSSRIITCIFCDREIIFETPRNMKPSQKNTPHHWHFDCLKDQFLKERDLQPYMFDLTPVHSSSHTTQTVSTLSRRSFPVATGNRDPPTLFCKLNKQIINSSSSRSESDPSVFFPQIRKLQI